MGILALASLLLCAGQDDLRKVQESGTFNLYPGRGRVFHQRLLAGGSFEIALEVKSGAGIDLRLMDSENFVKFTRGEKVEAVITKEAATEEAMKMDLPAGNWFLVLRGSGGERKPELDGDDLVNIWLAGKVGGPWGGTLAFLGAVAANPRPPGGASTKGKFSLAWSYSMDALRKAQAQEAEVKANPQKSITATAGALSHAASPGDSTLVDSLEIENASGLDIVLVKLKVSYFQGDREIGSRVLTLQGVRFLPRNARIAGGVKPKKEAPPGHSFSYAPGDVRVPGKADRASVTVLEVKPE